MEQITNKEILEKLKHIEKTMATKEELDAALETIVILSNEDTIRQIKESEKDVAEGKFRKIISVNDL